MGFPTFNGQGLAGSTITSNPSIFNNQQQVPSFNSNSMYGMQINPDGSITSNATGYQATPQTTGLSMPSMQNVYYGIGAAGGLMNAYTGLANLGLQKKAFEENKLMNHSNYNANALAYNTKIDRYNNINNEISARRNQLGQKDSYTNAGKVGLLSV